MTNKDVSVSAFFRLTKEYVERLDAEASANSRSRNLQVRHAVIKYIKKSKRSKESKQ